MTTTVEQLVRYGYTEREARFVGLAAMQSGYFVRRQFNDFARSQSGAVGEASIKKSIGLNHVTGTTYLGRRIVYHFTSFTLYSTLGDPNNRNRRLHQTDTVRRRLMALDYCIANSEVEYLRSEKDKVLFFCAAGVPEEELPSDVFGGKARRHFVDRQPIGANYRLAFIDDGYGGFSPWQGFLVKHRALLQRHPQCVLVYASPEERRFRTAERLYREAVTGSDASGTIDRARLSTYFEARKLFEARQFASFNQLRLDQLREDRKVFSGGEMEKLFSARMRNGDQALTHLSGRELRLQFHLLGHRYDWLSPIRKEILDAANSVAGEKGKRGRYGQVG